VRGRETGEITKYYRIFTMSLQSEIMPTRAQFSCKIVLIADVGAEADDAI
jgi:hypothetical protein